MNEFEQIHLLDQFNGLKHEIALADGLMSMLAAGGYDVMGLRKDQYRVSVDVSQVMSATEKLISIAAMRGAFAARTLTI